MIRDEALGLFRKITALHTEPVLLVAADSRVLAANPAAVRLLPGVEDESPLSALVSESADDVDRFVRQWLRTGHPTPAGLTLHGYDGVRLRCRCFGARAQWLPAPAVHLRAVRIDPGDRFLTLKDRVNALERERILRFRATEDRAALNAALAAVHARLGHLHALVTSLAAAATPEAVGELVAKHVPTVLGCTRADLHLKDSTPVYANLRIPVPPHAMLALTTDSPPLPEHLASVTALIGGALRRF
ncbi:PAS domain-containing protein [Streptomyces sp. Je 1-369]|uniref:PAS domain-containing protein n=1 Tax=Streptomyces sp. Je 1-369 TaxID=2966192 RepID=UPI00228641F0|nr:PAS domain-containing protein [Streptomyces sp. Je 1-369]WAL99635.1 PAS domain-containing protein [Streptomyces sp. Je 1-369]